MALLAACAALPAPEEAADPIHATAAQVETGRVLAEAHCGACHAIGVSDKSRVRAAPAFRRLSERYAVDDLAESLAEGIVTGHPDMPEWVLDRDEITELLGYIDSIQVKRKR
jgi:mono/diheme cytochrome c family protein